jgi:Fic family protein
MYNSPHQFTPLLPELELEPLQDRIAELVARSVRLGARAHPTTLATLRELVRAMNSYYSNRIEGQSTHPRNIDAALRADFSAKPDVARLQRIAIAHIEAEKELELLVSAGEAPLTSAFILKAHAALYGRLAPEDRLSPDGKVIEPGQVRLVDVDVGKHVPPGAASLPGFLARFDEVYGRAPAHGERSLLPIASAHHRMAWVHPFLDGNGRAVRLQTHAALWPLTCGLWSVNRGLARARDRYYERLADADGPRRGDFDGRGNLSERGLRDWCSFFLDICEDQVGFMTSMLDLNGVRGRIAALITLRSEEDKDIRRELIVPMYHLFAAGPVSRGDFAQMSGMGERTARKAISKFLATGLLVSDGPYAPVRFGAPLDALLFLFPGLYPEAAVPQ